MYASIWQIYTIDKSYRVGLRFEASVAEVESNLDQIKGYDLYDAWMCVIERVYIKLCASEKLKLLHKNTRNLQTFS